ncbi:hypothetical protein HDU93_008545 [Gonapodya sp. JEL0774]|nr:hypothetical protein HDU93_008545 [Gonapodya sp. JEL0774]
MTSTDTLNTDSAALREPQSPPAEFEKVDAKVLIHDGKELSTGEEEIAESGTRTRGPSNRTAENGMEYSPVQFVLLFVGLALAVFLAALDQTIVSVAIPSIVTDFQTFSGLSWVGTAYFLGSVPLIPTYGKFAEAFGRKPVFMVAIAVFEIGSLICGLAPNMNTLIVGRAIAGLGGGAMLPLVIIIISDLVSLRDRPKYQGLIGACFGLASVAGPLMGGAFTDHLSWRWCFFINLPVGGLAITVVLFFLNLPPPQGSVKEKLGKIDYLGTFWLAAATVLLVYALSAGGEDYEWSSAPIISMIVVSVVCLAVFAFVENKVVKIPIIPFELWKSNAVIPVWFCAFVSLAYYIPIYFQVVNGSTASEAGVHTIPFIMGVVTMSISSGLFISKTGYTTPTIHIGAAFVMVGAGLTSTLTAASRSDQQVGYLLLSGLGIGLMIQSINLNGQNAVPQRILPLMIASFTFYQFLGGVFGIAVCGTIYSNTLNTKLVEAGVAQTLIAFVKNSPSKIQLGVQDGTIPPEVAGLITDAFTSALSLVFKTAIATSGALLITRFVDHFLVCVQITAHILDVLVVCSSREQELVVA